MTTEPKFVPNEAVEISLGDNADVRVRMIDCVGYLVPGAEGDMDGDSPRMVHTPWAENAMPFREAAGAGDEKGHYRPFHHRDGSDNGRERDRAAAGKL